MEALLLDPDRDRRLAGLTVSLPLPTIRGGMPLMQALALRRSRREFSARRLPQVVLSNLLWAAFGMNRVKENGRTAPSARDWQEIDVLIALEEGVFVYDAEQHCLKRMSSHDVRAATGVQPLVNVAPVELIYVADLSRATQGTDTERLDYAWSDCGFIAENVYLYCASEGLATVVRGSLDRDALAAALNLPVERRVILAQSVGYPAE